MVAPRRLVVGITGATGAAYGVVLLQRARSLGVESHLVVTPAGVLNAHHECGLDRRSLEALATSLCPGDVGACWPAAALPRRRWLSPMLDETLAAIATAGRNLLTRAADVTLKERRRLLLMVRETPLNLAHLRNMTAVTEMGGIIFPPLPAFYLRPTSIEQIVADSVERVLALLGFDGAAPTEWNGL